MTNQPQLKEQLMQQKAEEAREAYESKEPVYYQQKPEYDPTATGQKVMVDPLATYTYQGQTIKGSELTQRIREEKARQATMEMRQIGGWEPGFYEQTDGGYRRIEPQPGAMPPRPDESTQLGYLVSRADEDEARALEFHATHPRFPHPAVHPKLYEISAQQAYESLTPEEREQFQEQFPTSSIITPEERIQLIEEQGSRYGSFEVDGEKKTFWQIKQEEPAAYLTAQDGQVGVEIDPVRWRREQYEQMTPEGRLARIGSLSIIRAVDYGLYASALYGKSEEYIANLEYGWHKEYGIGTEKPETLRFVGTEGAVLSPPMTNVIYPYMAGVGLLAAFGGIAASGAVGARTFMQVAPKVLTGTIVVGTIEDTFNTLDREIKGIEAPGSTLAKVGTYGTMFGMAGLGAKTVQQYKPTYGLAEKDGTLYVRKHLTTFRGKPVLPYGEYGYVGEGTIGKVVGPAPKGLDFQTELGFRPSIGRVSPSAQLVAYHPSVASERLLLGKGFQYDVEKSLLENIVLEQQQKYKIAEFEPAQITKLTEDKFLFDIMGKEEPIEISGKGKIKRTPEGEIYSLYAGEVSVKTPSGIERRPFMGKSESEELTSIWGMEVPSKEGVSYKKQKGISVTGEYVDDTAKFLFDEIRTSTSITESEILKGGERFLTYGKSKGVFEKKKVPYSVRGEVADISEGKEFIPYADKGISLIRHVDIGSLIDIPITREIKQEPFVETKKPSRPVSKYETIPKEWKGVYDIPVVSETIPRARPERLTLSSMMGKTALDNVERAVSPQKAVSTFGNRAIRGMGQFEAQESRLGEISLNELMQIGRTVSEKPALSTEFLQSPISAKRMDIQQIESQIENQMIKQSLIQEQETTGKTTFAPPDIFSPRPTPIRKFGMFLPESKISETGLEEITGEQGYIGQYKGTQFRNGKRVSKGEWIDAHKRPKTKMEALATAAEVADNTASMSITTRKAKGKPVKGKSRMGQFEKILFDFNNKGDNIFIEKRKNAIDSEGEIEQISKKGWESRAKKGTKRNVRSFGGLNNFERRIGRLMKRGLF